jgi:hypothetical protein
VREAERPGVSLCELDDAAAGIDVAAVVERLGRCVGVLGLGLRGAHVALAGHGLVRRAREALGLGPVAAVALEG